MSADFKAQLLGQIPVGRFGQSEDLGQTICFLLSDESAWVTGQVWSVNGGAGYRD